MQDKKINFRFKEFIDVYRKQLTLVGVVILSTAVFVIALTYLPSFGGGGDVPESFSQARIRAGDAANRISEITDTYKASIEAIAEAERSGNYSAGQNLILQEVEKNEKVSEIAGDLAEELGDMARSAQGIRSDETKEVALSAVSTGIELVQHIITYNNATRELLSVLEVRLENGGGIDSRAIIEELISILNEEADTINRLGGEYRELMSQFDKLAR